VKGAAVVDVRAGVQAGQVGVAIGVVEVGQACGAAWHMDAATADGVSAGVGAMPTVRPGRRGWREGRRGAHVLMAPGLPARDGRSAAPWHRGTSHRGTFRKLNAVSRSLLPCHRGPLSTRRPTLNQCHQQLRISGHLEHLRLRTVHAIEREARAT
jgi:hypothetical protein